MSMLSKLIEKNKDDFINDLFDDETKAKIVKGLNDAVDIPFISEKTEGKIIASVINVVEDVVKGVLLKKL